MDKIATKIFEYYGPKWSPISLRSDPSRKLLTGRILIHLVVILILIINLGLGILYISKPNLFPLNDANSLYEIQNDIKELSDIQKGLESEHTELDKRLRKILNHQAKAERAKKDKAPKANAADTKSRVAD